MKADRAADVNPRAEHDVLQQRVVRKPQNLSGMHQAFRTIERLGLADLVEIADSAARSITIGTMPSARPTPSDSSLAFGRSAGGTPSR